MRPVDADALERKWRFDNEMVMVVDVTEIRNAPTIEPKTARWEDEYGGRYANPRYRCSACKAKALFHFEWDGLGHEQAVQDLSDHCHKCGAKMCKEADYAADRP